MAAPSFLSPPSNPVVALPSSASPPIRGGARTSRDCWNLLLAFVICIVLQGGCDMHMHIATVAESASETDHCRACVWNEWIRLRSPTPPAAHGDRDFEVLTCSRGNMKETSGNSTMEAHMSVSNDGLKIKVPQKRSVSNSFFKI